MYMKNIPPFSVQAVRCCSIMVTHSQHDSTYAHRVLHLFDGELVKDLANKL